MKTFFFITLFLIFGILSIPHAQDLVNSEGIYKNQIDQMISFYQARLYLKDSEFKILSDIARDAQRIILFLEDEKEELIMEMRFKKIDFRRAKMRGFILNKARHSRVGFGYTQP